MHRIAYIDPEDFPECALKIWRAGKDFTDFAQNCLVPELSWKAARNQDRGLFSEGAKSRGLGSTASELHTVLALGYQKAQQKIKDEMDQTHHSLTERDKTLKAKQSQCAATYQALTDVLSRQVLAEHKDSQQHSIQKSPLPIIPKDEKKLESCKQTFRARVKEFWQWVTQKAVGFEQQFIPPCGFILIAWPLDCPHLFMGQWTWGLLVTDPAYVNSKRWKDYATLFNRYLLKLTLRKSIPIDWILNENNPQAHLFDRENLSPYQQLGRCFMVSQTQREHAENLWKDYQKNAASKLTNSTRPTLWKTNLPPAFETTQLGSHVCNPAHTLLRPLLLYLYELANHFDLAPDTPEKLLTQLREQKHLHPDFMADFAAAYDWALTHTENLYDAWLNNKVPSELMKRQKEKETKANKEAYLLDGASPSEFSSSFYLSAHKYQHHYRYALEVLQSVRMKKQQKEEKEQYPKKCQKFDPLLIYCQNLLVQAAQSSLTDDQAFILLDKLTEAMVHRPALKDSSWQLGLFLNLTETRQLYYLQKLKDPDLIDRLRHAPGPSGRRACWAQEQAEWADQLLPQLWISEESTPTLEESKSITSAPKHEPTFKILPDWRYEDWTVPPERKIEAPKISIVRRTQHQGQLKWAVKTHILKPEIAAVLFDSQGNWRPKDPKIPGNHRVFPIKVDDSQFWVKAYPEQPAVEWIVHQLDRRMGIFGTPRFEVVKFHHGNQTSCALISEHMEGITLKKMLKEKPEQLDKLEFISFARTLLRVLLINPEDDKDDDYLLEEKKSQGKSYLTLKRIDNERAFFDPLSKEDTRAWFFKSKPTLQVKSVVYCLEQMQKKWPNESAIQQLLTEWEQMQSVTLMQDLLQQAAQQHAAWYTLFSLAEVERHFNRPDPEKSLPLMYIPSGLTKEIITRLTIMRTSLRLAARSIACTDESKEEKESKKASTYPLSGLSLLQDTQPKLAEYYKLYWGESTEIKPDHRRSAQRFNRALSPLYQKNEHGEHTTKMGTSQAIQTTLHLKAPLKPEQLRKIWWGEECTPKQELVELEQWHDQRVEELTQEMLAPKEIILDKLKQLPQNREIKTKAAEEQLWRNYQACLAEEFRGLPLRQRNKMWRTFRESLRAKKLDHEQQLIILNALTGAGWSRLDLTAFSPELITNERVTQLLKGAQEAVPSVSLLTLDISGCQRLTVDIVAVAQRYSYKTLKQFKCNRMIHPSWQNLTLQNWEQLQLFECTDTHTLAEVGFRQVPNLRTVDLARSGVTTLWGEAPQLVTLGLNQCQRLRHLGQRNRLQNWSLQVPRLKQLHIQHCTQLESICVIPAAPVFEGLAADKDYSALIEVDVQTEQGTLAIPDFLVAPLKNRVNTLDYSGDRKLSKAQLKALVSYLPVDCTIISLNLRANPLAPEEIQLLIEALENNWNMTALDVSNTGVFLEEWEELDRYLQRNRKISSMLNKLKTDPTLTSLDLEGNQLGLVGMQALAHMLKFNRSLTSLNLWDNQIGLAGAQFLVDALKFNSTLTSLELEGNQLSAAGAQVLADMLKFNHTLISLNLWGNQIGTAGTQAIADSLKLNTTLTSLNLRCNKLGSTGAQAVAHALRLNCGLTSLNLGYNQIDAAGAQALADALKLNSTLTSLDLRKNEISAAGLQALVECLKTNTTLTELYFDEDLSPAGIAARDQIAGYLARNRQLRAAKKTTTAPPLKQKQTETLSSPLDKKLSTYVDYHSSIAPTRSGASSSSSADSTHFSSDKIEDNKDRQTEWAALKEANALIRMAELEEETLITIPTGTGDLNLTEWGSEDSDIVWENDRTHAKSSASTEQSEQKQSCPSTDSPHKSIQQDEKQPSPCQASPTHSSASLFHPPHSLPPKTTSPSNLVFTSTIGRQTLQDIKQSGQCGALLWPNTKEAHTLRFMLHDPQQGPIQYNVSYLNSGNWVIWNGKPGTYYPSSDKRRDPFSEPAQATLLDFMTQQLPTLAQLNQFGALPTLFLPDAETAISAYTRAVA